MSPLGISIPLPLAEKAGYSLSVIGTKTPLLRADPIPGKPQDFSALEQACEMWSGRRLYWQHDTGSPTVIATLPGFSVSLERLGLMPNGDDFLYRSCPGLLVGCNAGAPGTRGHHYHTASGKLIPGPGPSDMQAEQALKGDLEAALLRRLVHPDHDDEAPGYKEEVAALAEELSSDLKEKGWLWGWLPRA